jgi:hypothetical protein
MKNKNLKIAILGNDEMGLISPEKFAFS